MKKAARLVCAWCGRDLGVSRTPRDSHGLCRACKARVFDEYGLWQVKARGRSGEGQR